MQDNVRRLIENAFAEKAIPEEYDDRIKEFVGAVVQLMRSKGGASTAKLRSGKVMTRRMILAGLIDTKLPQWNQQHLLSEKTIDKLEPLMRDAWPYSVTRSTLVKDLQAIRRERRKKKVVTA